MYIVFFMFPFKIYLDIFFNQQVFTLFLHKKYINEYYSKQKQTNN